ncbi:MAG: competence/damage-inducible protein A [Acidimicrobiia bacterium]|nr:competence/damage-inducible protein A [Acidimicrobiia bacterium]
MGGRHRYPVVVAGPLTETPTAEILAIGSELLTPFRIDTNSLFLTGRLNDHGIELLGKSVVGDRPQALVEALRLAVGRASVVVTTGGLGPTDDDLTRDAMATVAGVPCHEDATVLEAIAERFARRKMPMPAMNQRQAMVPDGAAVLDNPHGTAPGLWLPLGHSVIVALPGPPREMKPMWETHVAPRLAVWFGMRHLRRRTLKIAGRGESHVDEIAAPIYGPLRDGSPAIETSILASPGQVELHLSAKGADVDALDRALDAAVCALSRAIGAPVFSVDGRELEEVVGDQLRARGGTVAVAESCTGGMVLGRLTNVPGSSAWVTGGVVAYDNLVKVRDLGVPEAVLAAHGAVSELVASAMAAGVRARMQTDVGVGITGIAGPTGGTDAKPVGTVVIAVDGPDTRHVVRTLRFPGDRAMVRQMSVQTALDLLRRACAEDCM